ncbi:MAG: mechanosensitive ion channel family protein [Thermoguttaceae bacterium]|nr:mechanosensitive ion channel family protein [Thermoguttaceae bacterium]
MDTVKTARALISWAALALIYIHAGGVLPAQDPSAAPLPAPVTQDGTISRSLEVPQTPSLQVLPHPGAVAETDAALIASAAADMLDQPIVGTQEKAETSTEESAQEQKETAADQTDGATDSDSGQVGDLSRTLTREEVRQLEGNSNDEAEEIPPPAGLGSLPVLPIPQGFPPAAVGPVSDSDSDQGSDGRRKRMPRPPVQVVVVPDAKGPDTAASGTEPTEAEVEKAVLISQTKTPRLALSYFLKSAEIQDYGKAVKIMDFSNKPGINEIEKQALAYQLFDVLNRLSEPNPDLLPDEENIHGYRYQPNAQYDPLFLVKQDGKFVFSADTIDNIPAMLEEVKDLRPAIFYRLPVLRSIPDWWFRSTLGLRRIQWVLLLLVLVIGYGIGLLCSTGLYYMTITSFHLMSRDLSEYKISKKTWRPVGWFVTYVVWYIGLLGAHVPPKIVGLMGSPIKILAIAMFVITGLRFIDILALSSRKYLLKTKSRLDEILVPLVSRAMKIVLVVIGMIMILQSFGFSAVGIISGMGIGGIAIALAAQNTIANLFGSVTVLMDRPFVIGDWIVTNNIEGEVEVVGLRSTRIRTFYNSLVTVPNNVLTTAIIDNMGRRHFRRYKTMLGVQYDTPPDRIEAFCEGIKELILSYNFTRKDKFSVEAYEFSASSIDILLNCFFLVPDTAAEYKARSTLILDILRLAEKMDVRFAFPTQTIYNVPSQDKGYDDPNLSSDEFGRSSASLIIDRREAAENARRRAAVASISAEGGKDDVVTISGSVTEPLSRKTEEVLKKRNFFRRAG